MKQTLLVAFFCVAALWLIGCSTPRDEQSIRIRMTNAPATTGLDPQAKYVFDYDRKMVGHIEQTWQAAVARTPRPSAPGKVVVQFKLHNDGRVSDIRALPTDLSARDVELCTTIIRDAAPFGRWTDEMKRLIGSSSRDISFTFHYR